MSVVADRGIHPRQMRREPNGGAVGREESRDRQTDRSDIVTFGELPYDAVQGVLEYGGRPGSLCSHRIDHFAATVHHRSADAGAAHIDSDRVAVG